MPIREYRCELCGEEFESLVGTDEIVFCPSCHSTDIQRMVSNFSFYFKGGV